METTISELLQVVTSFMDSLGIISGFILVILESIIPLLPLAVFIALNVITFGSFLGFMVSWLATVVGCMIAFMICRKLRIKLEKNKKINNKISKFKNYIDKLSYSNLVILMAVPFTPAFAINIGAGLSDIEPKKFFTALFVGKLPMVYFWGFIGKSLMESITDPYTLAQIITMIILAYLVSKVVNKFLK